MILEALPANLLEFLTEIENLGFSLTLVGGAVRDFLHFNQLGYDLDFEIRSSKEIATADWPHYYKKLVNFLNSQNKSYSELPYLITRTNFGEFKLEFSSPRLENNKNDDFSHHHFEAILDSHLSYEESFRRRDLSLNAIGIECCFKEKQERIIDPYNGVLDLENKVLRHINSDFFLDNVRFLRLIRFQIKFSDFKISDDLIEKLANFNLTALSPYHFKEELFKSIPSEFLNRFKALVKENQLRIPDEFDFWIKYNYPSYIKTKEEILAFVYQNDPAAAYKVVKFFSMPKKKYRDLDSFVKSYEKLKKLKKKDLLDFISLPKEIALGHDILKELKNIAEKKEWRKHLHLVKEHFVWDLDDIASIKISPEELQELTPSLRSYLPYFKLIKASLQND